LQGQRAAGPGAAIAAAAEERLPEQAAARAQTTPALTPSAQRALLDAYQVARAFGSTYIDPEHVFFALVVTQEAPAGAEPGRSQAAGRRAPGSASSVHG
jgi:ATP-dependent Clp protease ATP-binding subunit ClpC